MKPIKCSYGEVEQQFPELLPLVSLNPLITAELASAGYWATIQDDKYYLVTSYLPSDHIQWRLGGVRVPESDEPIDVEEYDSSEEWAQRIQRLVDPGGGTSNQGAAVPVPITPPVLSRSAANPIPSVDNEPAV